MLLPAWSMERRLPHDADPAMGGTPGSRTGEGHEMFNSRNLPKGLNSGIIFLIRKMGEI